jgi:hypothetical protein
MSRAIQEAKKVLPLPELMTRLGLGNHAKKSAKCPFHEDRRSSFSVWQKDGAWFFKCHAGCGEGDEIAFLEQHNGLTNGDAIRVYSDMAGVKRLGKKPKAESSFDWQKCVDAFTEKHTERLAEWRGYSGAFCSWLHKGGLVGLFQNCIADCSEIGCGRTCPRF